MKRIATIPSYTFEDTSNPELKRFCDRNGDWEYYYNTKTKKFLPSVNYVLGLGYAKSEGFYKYLLNTTKEEAERKLKTKGEEGTRTHMAIRDLISGLKITMTTKYFNELTNRQEVLSNDEWDNLGAWIAFCERYKLEVIANEFASHDGIRAGTVDFLGILSVPDEDKAFHRSYWGKKVLVLLDWKTSSGIWPEYKSQVGIYSSMVRISHKFDKFFKAYPFFTGVVRIGTKHKNGGYELEIWGEEETQIGILKFEAAWVIGFTNEKKKLPEIEQIPTEYYIKLPQAKIANSKVVRPNKKAKVDIK